jgi:excisionase family DNA binding protein
MWSGMRRCSIHWRIPLRIAYGPLEDKVPVLEGYGKYFAMSIGLRRGNKNILDASAWISQSEAARLRGVSREAIYNLVKKDRFITLKIGDKTLINRADLENYQPHQSGRRPKKRGKETVFAQLQGLGESAAPPDRTRVRAPGRQNKYLINTSGEDQNLQKYISQAEAARIRGVSYQAITDLIKRGRLTTAIVAGRPVVLRAEVENFVAQPKLGRPAKKTVSKKSAQGK